VQLITFQHLHLLFLDYNFQISSYSINTPTLFVVPSPKEAMEYKLSMAAAALREDYEHDAELTIFSTIDGDPFHE